MLILGPPGWLRSRIAITPYLCVLIDTKVPNMYDMASLQTVVPYLGFVRKL